MNVYPVVSGKGMSSNPSRAGILLPGFPFDGVMRAAVSDRGGVSYDKLVADMFDHDKVFCR